MRFIPWARLGTLAVAASVAACGCVLTAGEAAGPAAAGATPAAQDPGPRVQDQWQARMLELLKSGPATEAWGLFSAGGWSDAGQVIVLLSADRKVRRLVTAAANKAQITLERDLTDAEIAALEPALKEAPTLDDVDETSFDGIEFELVRAMKPDAGTPVVADRLFVRDPGTKPRPRHRAVIDAFQRLRRHQ